MKRLMLIAILMAWLGATAQELKVVGLEATNGVITANKQVRDLAGDPCAMVRVMLPVQGVTFQGNIVGRPTFDGSTYVLNMPLGSKELEVSCPGHYARTIHFGDYGVAALESKRIYELRLEPTVTPTQQDQRKYYLVIHVKPNNAIVEVDGNAKELDENGDAVFRLPAGTYSYHITAPGYKSEDNTVTIENSKREFTVNLEKSDARDDEALGVLNVEYKPYGSQIYIDGTYKGTTPEAFELPVGKHRLKISNDDYAPHEHIYTVVAGETVDVSGTLSRRAATPGNSGSGGSNSGYWGSDSGSSASTQPKGTQSKSKDKRSWNIISLNVATGVETEHEPPSYGFNLRYEHVWKKGFGVGLDVNYFVGDYGYYSYVGSWYDIYDTLYIGPSFVYQYTMSDKWWLRSSLGWGLLYESEGGEFCAGLSLNVGVDYKFNKHWGIGIGVQDVLCMYDEPLNFLNGTLGVRYYF